VKKTFAFLLLAVHLAILGFSQTSISRFSFKLSGGIGYLSVGELNSALKSVSDSIHGYNSHVSGRFENIHSGMNFNLEAVYLITDRLGIGLGGGFFRISKEDKVHTYYYSLAYTRTISCVPLILNVHYTYPLGSKLNLSLSGGVGYYLTSFEFKEDLISVTNTITGASDFKIKGTVGLKASLGLEMALTKNLGVFVAATGWYATLSGFTGDLNIDYTNDNVSTTEKRSDIRVWVFNSEHDGIKCPGIWIAKDGPKEGQIIDGPFISNVHELKIDLSGFSLGVGLRINF